MKKYLLALLLLSVFLVSAQETKKQLSKLHAEFTAIPGTIVIPVPAKGVTVVAQKDAHLERAFIENRVVGKSFIIGLYDQASKKYLSSLILKPGQIPNDDFDYFLVNKTPISLSPTTICYGGSWRLNYYVGKSAIKQKDQKFYVFVSLKENNGKIYSDKAYLVLADNATRSILLPKIPGRTQLPKSLDAIKEIVEVTVDQNHKLKVTDPVANFKRALPEVFDEKKPFYMGIYHGNAKKFGPKKVIKANDIPMDGKYHLIKISDKGENITSSTVFYAGKWNLAFQIGRNTDSNTKYIIFASLKREEKRILGDKIVLVPENKCPKEL